MGKSLKKKKTRFLAYSDGIVVVLLGPFMLLALLFGVIVMLLTAFETGNPLWFPLFMIAGAAMYFLILLVLLYMFLAEVLFRCAIIEINEEGISRSQFGKESYRWDEVTQFGVTFLEPPARKHPLYGEPRENKDRSIYMVFGLPGEESAVEWDISRFGAYEYWLRSEKPERTLGFVDDIFRELDRRSEKKFHDEVYDCFFPKRFMAMKFTTERFLLINSYLKKAGVDPVVPKAGDS